MGGSGSELPPSIFLPLARSSVRFSELDASTVLAMLNSRAFGLRPHHPNPRPLLGDCGQLDFVVQREALSSSTSLSIFADSMRLESCLTSAVADLWACSPLPKRCR